MTSAFEKIMEGLSDAEAFLDGERSGFVVHEIEIPEPDVREIRERTGLSQVAFARSIGVAPGTVRNWEQGRRRPHGPARVLLALLNEEPAAVQNMLILGSKRTS